MKPLSETLKKLGIAFTFPIEIKDSNGNQTYYEASNGFSWKAEYDSDGRETYCENSNGFCRKSEYDSNGNKTYYKDSYRNKRVTPRKPEMGYDEGFEEGYSKGFEEGRAKGFEEGRDDEAFSSM